MRAIIVTLALLTIGPALAGSEPSRITAAARDQVGVTVTYDPGYVRLEFPGGDLPRDRGVCTDVVIRALRDGWGVDLQLAVNRDMKADFAAYPPLWGLSKPDRNIDHRRVPNLQTFLARIGAEVPLEEGPAPYLPGDIVTWMLPGNLPHIGIVSSRTVTGGDRPLVVHNIALGALEEDVLFAWTVTGHYRMPDSASPDAAKVATGR